MSRVQFQPECRGNRPRGFTLVELTVVIAVVALLVSIVVVVGGRVRGSAEAASTRGLMTSIKQALGQFYSDFGYYPPLLDEDLEVPQNDNDLENINHNSVFSLVPYLIGLGDLNRSGGTPEDEAFDPYDDGAAGVGFRDPGIDQSWGGSRDAEDRLTYWQQRETDSGELSGKVYPAYLEYGNEGLLRASSDVNDIPDLGDATYVLVDYWGYPIRYYRSWPGNRYWPGVLSDLPTNWEDTMLPEEIIGARAESERESLKVAMRSAPFILFSPGQDNKADEDEITAEENRDNLLEIGS